MKNEVLRETKRKDRVSIHLGALSIHVPRGMHHITSFSTAETLFARVNQYRKTEQTKRYLFDIPVPSSFLTKLR